MKKLTHTPKDIVKYYGYLPTKVVIPAGTSLIPASNLEGRDLYWVDELPAELEANPYLESWHRNYGILIYPEDLRG